jgi:hypothetical protein
MKQLDEQRKTLHKYQGNVSRLAAEMLQLLVGGIQVGKKKAVKKADAMLDDRVPRKEPYTSARMSGVLERIREQATRMSALARALDDAKIDSIVVDGHAMLIRGLNQIENFLDNASRAVREAKTARETL